MGLPPFAVLRFLSCPSRRCVALGLLLAGASVQAQTAAPAPQPRLLCRIDQAGEILELEALPLQDPYQAPLHDIHGRFLFKMVLVASAPANAASASGSPGASLAPSTSAESGAGAYAVDYVKIYAYDNARTPPTLVQYARYLHPAVSSGGDSAALTGIQTVYSAWLEREMQYQCALRERQP